MQQLPLLDRAINTSLTLVEIFSPMLVMKTAQITFDIDI